MRVLVQYARKRLPLFSWGLMAVLGGIFLSGCTTVPSNAVLIREGRGTVMKEVMEEGDKIIQLSQVFDPDKPVLLLLHGATDDPTEMMAIAQEWMGQYDVFLYSYNYHRRIEIAASDLTGEIKRLKMENRRRGPMTVLVYSYSANVFRETVIMANDPALFADVSLVQLVPTAGGSRLASSLKIPVAAWLVSLASQPSTAENPYGRFAKHIWGGEGNETFNRAIPPQRIHTLLLEGDSHSLAGVRDEEVQQRYKNGIGLNVVVVPATAGVTHDYFTTEPVALGYLREILDLTRGHDERANGEPGVFGPVMTVSEHQIFPPIGEVPTKDTLN